MKKVYRGVLNSLLCAAVVVQTVFCSSLISFATDVPDENVIEETNVEDEDELVLISESEAADGELDEEKDLDVVQEDILSENKLADTESSRNLTDALTTLKVSDDVASEDETNITWSFDASTGTLTISGNGPMQDYASKKETPWYSSRSKIRKVVVEEGITRIGSYCFGDINPGTGVYGDSTKFQLPSTLKSIGAYAFDYSYVYYDLIIPEGVTDIEPFAFANARIMGGYLIIKAKITKLEANACKGIYANKVYFPDTLEEIGDNAFLNALSLKSITFPASLKKIGSKAFSYRSLAAVKFEGDLPEIAEDAFKGANNNIEVTYDASRKSWVNVTKEKLGMGTLEPVFVPVGEPYVEQEPDPEPTAKLVEKYGATYYISEDGTKLTGFQTIEDKEYYFGSNGTMQKQTWVTVDGKKYYASEDGTLVKNQMMQKWGSTYCFDNEGVMQTGFFTHEGKDFFADEKGHVQKQTWITVDGKKYYAKADGTLAKNETIKKWGRKYSFDENGVLIK